MGKKCEPVSGPYSGNDVKKLIILWKYLKILMIPWEVPNKLYYSVGSSCKGLYDSVGSTYKKFMITWEVPTKREKPVTRQADQLTERA